jgi:hypothetical protein
MSKRKRPRGCYQHPGTRPTEREQTVDKKSLAHPAHKFAVVEIDEAREPIRLFALVEGESWERALELAFDLCREKIHTDEAIATGVFEISPDGSALRRVATAGYSRLSGGSRSSSEVLAGMVSMAVA